MTTSQIQKLQAEREEFYSLILNSPVNPAWELKQKAYTVDLGGVVAQLVGLCLQNGVQLPFGETRFNQLMQRSQPPARRQVVNLADDSPLSLD